MKKSIGFILLCFIYTLSFAQDKSDQIAIIPEPVSITEHSGNFVLPDVVTIKADNSPDLDVSVDFLSRKINQSTGKRIGTLKGGTQDRSSINLHLNKSPNAQLGTEGYQLSVKSDRVDITANQPAGIFYGVQSFIQLFPAEIEADTVTEGIEWAAPNVEVTDYPRFGWRGLMLDVSRHFFTKDEVKEFINQMVRYKFNLLHLHLTDDQGWRIEIKSLPKLTEVGAWNVKKEGYFGTFSKPTADEPRDYGGFYTQEDIKELVQYAKDRFVDIMPEIDVPGHSLAAIVAYPDLIYTPGADKYQVNSGESFMDWSHGAPPVALVNNTLNPANEKVYTFLDQVLTEVANLFPFEYIDLGGDEAPHNFWEKEPHVQALMKKEGLKTMNEVQSYFTRKAEKIVASKGKKLIGWDEILEGGLPSSVAVMSWRGEEGGIAAAKAGHEVVMSPNSFAYVDFMQGDPIIEPHVYSTLLLSKAYQFNPLPKGVDPKFIKGGQANLWTEQIYNTRHLEYMLWPRALAISESVWSPNEKKNWNHFFPKVEQHFKRLKEQQINYAPSVYDPKFKATKDENGQLKVELSKEVEDLDFHYSFDNSFPDQFYPKYEAPLTPPKDAVMLKVISYRGDKKIGRMIAMPISELNKRAGIK